MPLNRSRQLALWQRYLLPQLVKTASVLAAAWLDSMSKSSESMMLSLLLSTFMEPSAWPSWYVTSHCHGGCLTMP